MVFGQWIFNAFEGDPFWGGQVDREENLETRAIISYVSEPAKFGQGALRIDWGATHNQSWGGGAYLNHVHPDSLGVFDFSDYDSLILWYYNESPSTLPGKVHLRFNLGDVSDSPNGYNTSSFGNMEYWYTFNYILDDPPGWRKLSFPLVDVRQDPQRNGFNRTGWYGIVGNDHLDLDAIKGFQLEFSINATRGDVAMGTIVLDQMMLVTEGWTSVKRLTFNNPTSYSLSQNYPNPFNAVTKIDYSIPVTTFVQLKLYDTLGREIKTLVNEKLSAGPHTVRLEASDLPSGVYLYHLKAGDFNQVKKMILMK